VLPPFRVKERHRKDPFHPDYNKPIRTKMSGGENVKDRCELLLQALFNGMNVTWNDDLKKWPT
jgi:hypothetical protein